MDRRLLYLCAFLRATAAGMVGVVLALYLAARGLDPAEIGGVVTAGLAGGALAALIVTVGADRLGRRRTLIVISLLGAAGGLAVAAAPSAWTAMAAAFVGMVNGIGRDRGAALILDQAVLPSLAGDEARTHAFAWYNTLADAGHAFGALAAGVPVVVRALGVADRLAALQIALVIYAGVLALSALAYTRLSPAAEVGAPPRLVLAPESRRVLVRITALFALDSVAGGFLTGTMLTLFFHARWDAGELAVGALFAASRLANAGSNLAAAWLARRIGLVNTMVFTHLPSSLLLVGVALAPSFPVAAVFFLLREGCVQMDVPTRQSYVMAVVRPEERTVASGVTHLVRLAGWAVMPGVAGWLMRGGSLAVPLYLGAAMKIAYDLLLWRAFRAHRPPEER